MPTHRTPRPDRLLSFPDLADHGVPFTRQHLSRLERKGLFPRRVQISPGRVAWFENEIQAWKNERAAARYAPASDVGDDAPAPIAAAPRGR